MTGNDLTLYDRLSTTWWMPGGVLNQLADFNPLRMSYVKEVGDPLPGKTVLDIGCGGGIFSETLARAGARVSGIDQSTRSIEQARRHALDEDLRVDYHVADAAGLPFTDHSFDLVVASEVLEHVEDLQAVLGEIARVLRPGGLFVFDTPNRTWIARMVLIVLGERLCGRIPAGTHDGSKFIRPQELRQALRRCGIEIKDIRGFLYRGLGPDGRHRFRFSRTTALAYFGYGVRGTC